MSTKKELHEHYYIQQARTAIVAARNELGLTTEDTLALVLAGFGRALAPEKLVESLVRDPESWQAVAEAGRRAK